MENGLTITRHLPAMSPVWLFLGAETTTTEGKASGVMAAPTRHPSHTATLLPRGSKAWVQRDAIYRCYLWAALIDCTGRS